MFLAVVESAEVTIGRVIKSKEEVIMIVII